MRSYYLAAVVLLVAGSGCMATSFTGDARLKGGAAGCAQKCRSENLEMAGFVFMGEYSTACVCEPAGAQRAGRSASVAGSGGAVGVVLQMRAEQERQQAAQRAQQQAAFHSFGR